MTDRKTCPHPDFAAKVAVARMEDIKAFMAEVTVTCTACGEPFVFQGLEPGLHLAGARVSIDGQTALLAIAPSSSTASPLDVLGFNLSGKPTQ